jgi:hypothetical protein
MRCTSLVGMLLAVTCGVQAAPLPVGVHSVEWRREAVGGVTPSSLLGGSSITSGIPEVSNVALDLANQLLSKIVASYAASTSLAERASLPHCA